ncbi:T5orf172 domain-containing protein [Hyaloscypha sp. PMI_1271]|nr:T5orf172 domain-containing protein [Hyaloscypha sp. PMI_1271]
MPRVAKAPKNDEVKDNSKLVPRRSLRNAVPIITPLRPKSGTASTASSSSSSLRGPRIFDSGPKSPGTPLTPLVPDESSSSLERRSHVTNSDTSKQLLFKENTSNKGSAFATLPSENSFSTSTAAQLEESSLQDNYLLDNDLFSAPLSKLGIDGSPCPPTRAPSRRGVRPPLAVQNDSIPFMTKSGQSDTKGKARDFPRSGEATRGRAESIASAPKKMRAKILPNLGLSKDISSPSKGECPETLPVIALPTHGEGRVFTDNGSSTDGQPSPTAEVHCNEEAVLSPRQAPYKRSTSMNTTLNQGSGPHSSPVARISTSKQSSSEATASSESHTFRRRSTGSLDAVEKASPSTTQTLALVNNRPELETAATEPSNIVGTTGRKKSCRPRRIVQNRERGFPNLEDFNTPKKSQKSLKPEILEAIRGKKLSKYARLRALRLRVDNMWKAWSGAPGKLPRSPATEDDGYIYIFRSKSDAFPGPKYVKIGKTKQKPEKRKDQWRGTCKFDFVHVEDENDKRFLHYHKVERIVHAELYNERRKYKCNKCNKCNKGKRFHHLELGEGSVLPTPTEHGEWFEVSEEKALEVVNKWRDWVIKNEPYRPDGTLHARWMWKCATGSFWMDGTEDDWIAWREYNWLEILKCVLHHFKMWVEGVSPLVMELLMAPGAAFGLALVWYFWAWGLNFGSCVTFLAAVFALMYFWFEFC